MGVLDDLLEGAMVVAAVYMLYQTGGVVGWDMLKGAALLSAAYSSHDARRRASKAKEDYNNSLKDSKHTIKSPDAARNMILGRQKVGGVVLFAQSTGAQDKDLHLVVGFAGHEVTAFEQVWFNDKVIGTRDANGWVTSGEYGSTTDRYVTGNIPGILFTLPSLVNLDVLNAGSTDYEALVAAGPNMVSAVFTVQAVYAERYRERPQSNYAYTGRGTFSQVGNSVNVDPPQYPAVALHYMTVKVSTAVSSVRVVEYLGTDTQAADPTLVSVFPNKWTSNHTLRGIAYLHLTLRWNADLFGQSGLPDITAVIKGAKVPNFTGAADSWSQNAARCAAYWLTHPTLGPGVPRTELITSEWLDAQNTCEEAITPPPWFSGPYLQEKRYQINAVISSGDPVSSARQMFEDACAGFFVWSQGRHLLRPGKYRLPSGVTTTITDSDLAGNGIKVSPKPSRQALVNRVSVSYTSEEDKWTTKTCPPATSDTFVQEDNGLDLYQELNYEWCVSPLAAERYAKLYLERNRLCKTVAITTKLYVYDLQVSDTVYLTLSKYGLSNQVAEVMSRTLDFESMTITFVLRLIPVNIYDFDYINYNSSYPQEVVFNLPSAVSPVTAVSGVGLQMVVPQSLDDVLRPKAVLSWSAHADPFVCSGGHISVYLFGRGISETSSRLLARVTGDSTEVALENLNYGAITFLLVAENARGRKSEPTYFETDISEDFTPPAQPTGFVATILNGVVKLSWDDPRFIEIGYQHTLVKLGADWNTAAPLATTTKNAYEISWPATGAQTYRIKHVDWAGNESPEATAAVTGTDFNTKVDLSGLTGFSKSGLNLIISDGWKAGQSLPWTNYGAAGNNNVISAVSQRGSVSPIWRVTSAAGSTWIGGFVRSYHADQGLINIDRLKTYRVVQAFRRTGAGVQGLLYAGFNGSLVWAGHPNTICAANTSTPLNNPYFVSGATMASLPQDVWCLAVSYIYPAGSTITDVSACKIYRADTGAVTASLGAFCFSSDADQMSVRAGLYNTAGTGTTLDLMPPWIHAADGSEPSIQNLLSDTNLYSVAAYSGTVNYRNDVAPTASPVLGAIVATPTVDGNVVVAVNYTYAQGALPADFLYVYKKDGGGVITTADYAEMSDPVSGVHYFYVKPDTVYRYGVSAARRTDTGLKVTAIVSSADQAAVSGNYTSYIDGVPADRVQKNLIDASDWVPGAAFPWLAYEAPTGRGEVSVGFGIGPKGDSVPILTATAYSVNKAYRSDVSGATSFWFAAELTYTAATAFVVDTAVFASTPSGYRVNKATLAANGQGRATQAITPVAGESYTISMKVRGDTATAAGLTIRLNESSVAVVTGAVTSANRTSFTDVVTNVAVATTFTTYSLTYTPPAGTLSFSLAIVQEANGPLALYFDDIVVQRTADPVGSYDVRASGDGGINSSAGYPGNYFSVDPSKAYRLVIPVRRVSGTLLASGITRQVQLYFGLGGNSVTNLNTTTLNSNPYFISAASLSSYIGQWCIFVGYVYPYGQTGLTNSAKIVNLVTGAVTQGTACYNWAPGNTKASIRAFQYGADEGSVVEFGKPMVHELNGSEPTLSDMFPLASLHNSQQLWTDVNGAPKSAMFIGGDATTLGYNGAFGAWSSTLPDGWLLWAGSTVNVAADYTADSTRATDGTAALLMTPSAGVNLGLTRAVNLTNPMPAGTLLVGSVDIKITGSYTSGKCGLLVRLYAGPALTLPIDTFVAHPSNTVGAFQRVNWSARTANLTDQIYGIQIYIMACYSAFPGGSYVGGPVVFDNLQFNFIDKSLDNKSMSFSDTTGALTVTANGAGTVSFTAVTPNNKVTAANIGNYINDLAITNAKIGNVLRSNTFDGSYNDITGAVSGGSQGWALGKDGSMVVRAASVTGQLTTSQLEVGAATDSVGYATSTVTCLGYSWPNDSSNSFVEVVTPNSPVVQGLNTVSVTLTLPAGVKYLSLGLYNWINGPYYMGIVQADFAPGSVTIADSDYQLDSGSISYDGFFRVCNTGSTTPDAYTNMGAAFYPTLQVPGFSGDYAYALDKVVKTQGIGMATPWKSYSGSTTVTVKVRFLASTAETSGLYVRLFYLTSDPVCSAFFPDPASEYTSGSITSYSNALILSGKMYVKVVVPGDYRAANKLFLDTSKFGLSFGNVALTSKAGSLPRVDALGGMISIPMHPWYYDTANAVTLLRAIIPIEKIMPAYQVTNPMSLKLAGRGYMQVNNIAQGVIATHGGPAAGFNTYLASSCGIEYDLTVMQSKL
jgi:hypothetical protein